MINFDELPDNDFSEITLDTQAQERSLFQEERGTTMDILHDLWAGSGEALKLLGEGTGSETIKGLSKGIEATPFARLDTSQFYGTQGRIGRVVDGIARSLPTSVAIGGTAAVGGLLAGPVGATAGFTGAMGILGKGTFNIALDEVKKERPDLAPEEQFKYATTVALSEVGTEGLGMLIPFGIGKALSKPAQKALLGSLLDSGRITTQQAVGTIVKNAGGVNVIKGLFGGAVADGTSEIANELIAASARDAAGMEENPVDLIDIFLIGSAPGGLIAGGTMALDAGSKAKARKSLETNLQSTDADTRVSTVEYIANSLGKIDPEIGDTFRSSVLEQAMTGPVDLNTVIDISRKEETKLSIVDEIIKKPEAFLERKGIPLGEAELSDRTDLDATPEIFKETRVLDEGSYNDIPEFTDAIEESVKGYMNVSRDTKPLAGTPEYDEFILENDKLTSALKLNDMRSKGIKAGMAKVLQDSNKLAEIMDLDEREVLRKSIEKTKAQIAAEVKAVPVAPKVKKGKAVATAVVAPVEQKTPKGTVATKVAPTPKATVVAPVAKVEPKAPTVPVVPVKPVAVAKSVPVVKSIVPAAEPVVSSTIPEGKTYKEQLLITRKLEEDLARAQVTAKTGKPEEAVAARETAKLLGQDVQAARKKLQTMPKPKAAPVVYKNKTAAKQAQEIEKSGLLDEGQQKKATHAIQQGVDLDDNKIYLLKKHKGTPEEFVKSLETPQEVAATGVGEGRSVQFHEGTEIIYKGAADKSSKRWMIKQGTLTKRASSEPAARKAIAEGKVSELPDYEDKGKENVLTREMPKMNAEQKAQVTKFITNEKYEAYGNISDVSFAASTMAIEGTLYSPDGKLNVEGLRKKTKSIKDTSDARSSEAMTAGKAGVTSGVTESVELSTEEDIVLPADKPKRTAEQVKAEREAKKKEIEATLTKPELGADIQAQILAKHKERMAKQAGQTLEEFVGKTAAKRIEGKLTEAEEASVDEALYTLDDRLSWKKNREPKLTDEFIEQVIDNYMSPVNFNPLEALLTFSKQYPSPRTQELIDTQMTLVSFLMAEKTVMKNYFTNNYTNALELLDGVIANGSPEAKALAEFIKSSPKIKELESIPVSVSDGVSFFTARNGGAVTIRANAMMDVNVWLHEIQHAATSREILSNEKLRDEVKVMMRNMEASSGLSKDQLKAVAAAKGNASKFSEIARDYSAFSEAQMDIAYALVNEREFLAQMYSSEAVRDLARKTRHSAGSFKDSIWKRIKELFASIMRLPKEYDSVLEAALRVSGRLYRVNYNTGLEITDMALDPKRREETLDEATRSVLSERKPERVLMTKLTEKRTQALAAFKRLAQPISDSLKGISDKIYAKLISMEARQNLKGTEYKNGVEPFLRYYKGLTESQKVRLDIGLMNRNKEVWSEMPKDVRKFLEGVLDDIGDRSINVGYIIKKEEFYFPRVVKDIEGLVKHLTANMEENGPIALALKAKADMLGMEVNQLPQAIRNQVITDMLSSGEIMQLPRPGSSKKRTIGKVTSDLVPFYANSSDAILSHIYEANDKISLKEFVGASGRKKKVQELMALNNQIDKETDKAKRDLLMQKWEEDAKALSNLEEDLEGGIQDLIDKELSKAPPEVQREVFEMLSARMRQKGASGIYDTMRNVGYIATMGNFLSAITQLGDIPIIFYRYGVTVDNFKAIAEAFKAVGSIAAGEFTGNKRLLDAFVEDMDFTNALREFTSTKNISAKALETVFKYSGLKYMDLVGKETAMRASFKFYQNPKNSQKFLDKYENFFPDPKAVLQKIQMGNKKDKDVLTAIFAELSDFQPISLSQQSVVYLKSANARMFFALKTFTLRTTSAAITEGMMEMRKGGALNVANGVKKIAAILLIYAVAGAGADELKDLLKGKESSVSDNVSDNLLQMLFLSKYTLEKGIQQDQVLQGIAGSLLPPMRYMDNFIADVSAMFMESKEQEFKSSALIPVIGTIIQARSSAQQTSYADQNRKKILEQVKDNAKGRRGAYHGALTDKVREYNKGVSRDKRLTSSDIMSAYKR